MATEKKPATKVRARVLYDCTLGRCDDVVEVDESQLASLAGTVDADPAAVAYADSLKPAEA
jgi:hypothetical protein